ncbi:beta-ketoacyl synthase N-terminal-like domain-containing protein [Amycolatopsis sp. A133]|uniref:beta-ketoacyl synthase N-terminal-like domain-containing protein n=1 Tax=Amycolatopsis sp. A133 TaxID=3064472 RepID=UPI0027E914CF|nr:beta-ketoacyl synthase N-terminal-like domain-containing protein [Amycolatopsis sp. A133]MDQ7804456.1 beta-ketoacyl synthase N-terminal-like domain-containing protein [Amycolatopsis sp. A133]
MSDPTTDTLRRWLLDTVAEHTGAPAEPDRPLGDYGLSSRQAVGITADLEERLGRRLPATLLWESPTIDHLARSLTGADEPEARPATNRRRTDPVAVVGLGCRLPGADGPAEFWDLLCEGRDAVRTAPPGRWSPEAAPVLGGFLDDVAGFDAEHFGITPREAATMDPQQRMLLEVTWAALEDAGIAPASLRGSRTGVFTGIATHDYGHLTMIGGEPDLWTATGAAGSIAANRLSYVYDLRGPSMAVDTACSSSLVAVHHAVRALRDGDADLALAAGVNLMLLPGPTAAFAAAGLLAGDGRCKTFSAGADGIARAEGCGVVVLKRLADAECDGDRVLAVIRSSVVNSDGRSNGLAAPNPAAQQAMLRDAYRGLDPSTVDYVEAHGTGTLLGDPIEARALGAVLGAGREAGAPLLIGSVKTNIAHAEAAAGIAGLIKVVLAMKHGSLPPQLHFTAPNPHIAFGSLGLRVVTEPTPWPRHTGRAVAGVSAFGFGGTNAHVVVEEEAAAPAPDDGGRVGAGTDGRIPAQHGRRGTQAPAGSRATAPAHVGPRATTGDPAQPGHALPTTAGTRAPQHSGGQAALPAPGIRIGLLSARTRDRLAERAAQLADWLDSPAGQRSSLADVTHTLFRRDNAGKHRAALVAATHGELAALLRAVGDGVDLLPAGAVTGTAVARDGGAGDGNGDGPVFVFSGHGSQWTGMGRRLLAAEPAFAAQVDKLGDPFTEHAGRSLRSLLTGATAPTLAETQLAIFGTQVALAARWEAFGVRPAAVLGHSLGSAAAAVVAGVLTADEAVHLVATRARLLGTLRSGGAMAAVELTPDELAAHPGVELAVDAAQGQITVAGDALVLDRLVAQLSATGRGARRLPVGVAGHSAGVEPVLGALRDALAELGGRRPLVPWYDTVLTDPRELPDFDAGYWAAHLRRPVRFRQAVAAAAADGHRVFVEVSPHPILRGSLARTLEAAGITDAVVTGTLRRGQDEVRAFGAAAAALYCAGTRITLSAPDDGARLTDVPPMPWRHERHWYTDAARDGETTRTAAPETAPGDATAAPPARATAAPGGADRLTEIVAAIMGLSPDRLDPDVPLVDLGLDSLMANRIREAVRRELGTEPDAAAVLRGATLADLNRDLAPRGDEPAARGRAWDAADRLVLRLWRQHTGTDAGGTHVRLTGTGRPEHLARLLADGLTTELGSPVDPAELLRHDSLAAVADVARALLDTREERGPVHLLKAGDAGTAPLLLFHPGGSTCTVYRPLLDRLPAGVPCVGFERVPGAGIEERVERLLPLVRARRPHGPYRLAGWSFGGALAYGVATRLADEGEPVELVALIDTMLPLPEPDLDARASSARRFLRFTGYVEGTYGRAVRLGHDELAPLPEEEQIELTMRRVAEAGLLSPGVLRHQHQSFLDTLAAERGTPRPYDGRVVLYRATEPYAAGLAMEPRYSRTDRAAGWSGLCPRLEVVPVAAHHLSVVDPPHVDVVARHLAGLLWP